MPHGTVDILLIEDNPGDARLVREMLREAGVGHRLRNAPSLAAGLAELEREGAGIVLLDLGLPDSQGLGGLEALSERFPELPVVVLTGLSSGDIGFAAVRGGAQDYLTKEEVTGSTLLRTINYAIERQRLKSELRRTTQDLRASENRLRQLIEDHHDGMLIVNREGLVRFLNPAAERILERSRKDLLGKHFGYPLDAASPPELRIPSSSGQDKVCELRQVATRWQDEEVVLVALRDITERLRLEGQVRYAQKMESLGNLTRGVAHDFNNVLAAIIGYASVLEMKAGEQPPLLTPIRQILAAADRAATLTRALLSFSRNQPGEMHRLDLLEVLTRIGQILPSLLGRKIDLVLRLAPEPLWVEADSSQLEQVLFNLATNARQAMPDGGVCTLSAGREELTDDFRQLHGFGRPGSFARVALADTGGGVDPETCEKIFEPFFTTRETGEGSGLGLAIAYGIVKHHRGYILCQSEPGVGTAFEIYLPLAPEPARAGEDACPT